MDGTFIRNSTEVVFTFALVGALVLVGPLAGMARHLLGAASRLWRRVVVGRLPAIVVELSSAPLTEEVSPGLRRLVDQLRIVLRTIEPALARPHLLRDASELSVDTSADDQMGDSIGVTAELWRWLVEAESLLEREPPADDRLEHVTRTLRGQLFSQAPLRLRVERMVSLLVDFDGALRQPTQGGGYRATQADGSRLGLGRPPGPLPATLAGPSKGSHEGDEEVLRAHDRKVRAVARRYADDAASTEDLEQEIRLAVWRALPAFRGESSLSTYVGRIAHLCGARFARRQPRFEPTIEPPDPSSDLAEQIATEQRHARAVAALADLPPGQRDALTLQIAGHSYREIGEQLGISETNVSARVSRARARLRGLLASDAD